MSFDEHRDAEKICVLQEECHPMASGQNEVETTTMFTSIKQVTEITRNECFTDTHSI